MTMKKHPWRCFIKIFMPSCCNKSLWRVQTGRISHTQRIISENKWQDSWGPRSHALWHVMKVSYFEISILTYTSKPWIFHFFIRASSFILTSNLELPPSFAIQWKVPSFKITHNISLAGVPVVTFWTVTEKNSSQFLCYFQPLLVTFFRHFQSLFRNFLLSLSSFSQFLSLLAVTFSTFQF
jgi:hypothetical protein